MKKRKIIITQEQLNEIVGGSYFSDEGDGSHNLGGSEIFASSTIDSDNDNTTYTPSKNMDSFTKNVSRNLGFFSPFYGRNSGVPRNIKESNNADINSHNYQLPQSTVDSLKNSLPQDSFMSNAIENGINGENLSQYNHRFQVAKKKADLGDSTQLNNMGGEDAYNAFTNFYDQKKNQSKALRNANGNKIKSAPKQSGNGQAHTPKANNMTTNFFK